MNDNSLEFTDLPLIEVALKRVPRDHIPISLPFILELRQRLPQFDRILDLDVLEPPPGGAPSAVYDIQATPGCRLIDSNTGLAVSVQPDMLVARWTAGGTPAIVDADEHLASPNASEVRQYPRFAALRQAADAVMEAITDIGVGAFNARMTNMAYANRVTAKSEANRVQPYPWPLSEPWTPAALKEQGQTFETQSVLRGSDGIDRRVVVQFRPEGSDVQPWYLLLTVAGKEVSEHETLEECETAVHAALIGWFPMLLSRDAAIMFGLKQ